jgi:hypothetical protein
MENTEKNGSRRHGLFLYHKSHDGRIKKPSSSFSNTRKKKLACSLRASASDTPDTFKLIHA